jgi:hypothetical protein
MRKRVSYRRGIAASDAAPLHELIQLQPRNSILDVDQA